MISFSTFLYRFDRNIFFICEDITSKFLKLRYECNSESICLEIKLRKRKWFNNGLYNSNKSFIPNHIERLNCIMDEYSNMYQNSFILGDVNTTTNDKCMEEFCNLNGLTSLIKKPTYLKMLINPHACNVFETGLSDFRLLTVTEYKMGFQKLPPKTVKYRVYKNFDNETFRLDISKIDSGASYLEGFNKIEYNKVQYSIFLINISLLKNFLFK